MTRVRISDTSFIPIWRGRSEEREMGTDGWECNHRFVGWINLIFNSLPMFLLFETKSDSVAESRSMWNLEKEHGLRCALNERRVFMPLMSAVIRICPVV